MLCTHCTTMFTREVSRFRSFENYQCAGRFCVGERGSSQQRACDRRESRLIRGYLCLSSFEFEGSKNAAAPGVKEARSNRMVNLSSGILGSSRREGNTPLVHYVAIVLSRSNVAPRRILPSYLPANFAFPPAVYADM